MSNLSESAWPKLLLAAVMLGGASGCEAGQRAGAVGGDSVVEATEREPRPERSESGSAHATPDTEAEAPPSPSAAPAEPGSNQPAAAPAEPGSNEAAAAPAEPGSNQPAAAPAEPGSTGGANEPAADATGLPPEALPPDPAASADESFPPFIPIEQVNARAEMKGHLSGVILDPKNAPLANVRVKLGDAELTTGDDGAFFVEGVTPGTYELLLERGQVRETVSITIPAGEVNERSFVLPVGAAPGVTTANGLRAELLPGVGIISAASISPDGRRLAVEIVADETLMSDIWIIELDSGESRPVVTRAGHDAHPRWSPRGDQIAFHEIHDGEASVWITGASGDDPRHIEDGAKTPAWSPDGKELVFAKKTDSGWTLARHRLADGTTTPIDLDIKGVDEALDPYWGWVGPSLKILFSGGTPRSAADIWSIDPDGKNPVVLVRANRARRERYRGPVSTNDGKTIAFWQQGARRHALWLVRPDGGGKQRLLDDAAYPSWRTDGSGRFALYFTSKATGTGQAWRTPAAF